MNERPQTWSDLLVNSSLEAMASTLPKLVVLGVNLEVIEAKELEFDIYFNKYSLKGSNHFEQICNNSCSTADLGRLGRFLAPIWQIQKITKTCVLMIWLNIF